MAKRSFAGKRVILTGASSGIGWYLADELVRSGAYVVISARRAERLEQLRQAFGNPSKRLIAVPGDVADPQHRQALIDTAVSQLGGIDLVINNAGVGAIGPFAEARPERLRRIFEVDFFAAAELTRSALPHLQRGRQPAVCVVSSVLAHRAVPGKSEYCAAKFALRGWAEALRVELKPCGIDVVAISPSTTGSEFFGSLLDTDDRLRAESPQSPAAPARRLGVQSSQHVAHSILKAVRMRKRDLILSPGGKALVWLSRLAPRLLDVALLRYASPQQLSCA